MGSQLTLVPKPPSRSRIPRWALWLNLALVALYGLHFWSSWDAYVPPDPTATEQQRAERAADAEAVESAKPSTDSLGTLAAAETWTDDLSEAAGVLLVLFTLLMVALFVIGFNPLTLLPFFGPVMFSLYLAANASHLAAAFLP